MDTNVQAKPRMPPIKNFADTGPVGVLNPCCTIGTGCTQPWATALRLRRGPAWRRSPCALRRDILIYPLHTKGGGPKWILLANSGTGRLQHEPGESGVARSRQRGAGEPGAKPHQVHRRGRDHMLQLGLGQPDIGWIQAVVATQSLLAARSNWSSASAGVLQSSVFRGLALRAIATAVRSSALCTLRSVPFAKYWRSSPLVFSFVPRCQGLWGSQK